VVGYDLHKYNSVNLKDSEYQADQQDFNHALHMKGNTGYTSIFYNVDASTYHSHTELDWCMTTIIVPGQPWEDKEEDHLQFLFHLQEESKKILRIAMMPGTIVYFHGYLLTHNQRHKDDVTKKCGCCLNFSGYANKKLRDHFFKSYPRALARKNVALDLFDECL
jgi:hypothetical protein